MKRILLIVLNIVVLLLLIAAVYRLYEISNWNTWVNEVMVASQRGSNREVVEQMLGRPTEVRPPKSVGSGFSPRPPAILNAQEVYIYKRIFVGMGGYWIAYVYMDKSGQVVAVHIGNS